MCLNTIDEVTKRHLIGLKIVHPTLIKNVFESQYQHKTYEIGQWATVGENIQRIQATVGGSYPAGIHYYRDLKTLFVPDHHVVIKIKVRGIFVTGTDQCGEAGVCREILPLHVVEIISKVSSLDDFLKLTHGECYLDIFKRAKCAIPTIEQLKAIAERATKSHADFVKYICFIDQFDRDHSLFKFYTRVHMALLKGKIKDKKYNSLYFSIVNQDPEMMKAYKRITTQVKEMNIPNISRGQVA